MTPSAVLPLLVGLAATWGGAVPPTVGAHAIRHDLREFSQASTERSVLSTTPRARYDGRRAYDARYCGGPQNGFARGVMRVNWLPGSTWSYGVALLLPKAFARHQQGEVDLLRWDNYPLFGPTGDFGGIVLYDGDGRARLERGRYDGDSETIGKPFTLPRGRWFWLEVRQRLSAGPDATSTVTIDGRAVVASNAPNSFGRPIVRVRFGLVAIDAERQDRSLRLYFDRAVIEPWPIGPLTARQRQAEPRSRALARTPQRVVARCP